MKKSLLIVCALTALATANPNSYIDVNNVDAPVPDYYTSDIKLAGGYIIDRYIDTPTGESGKTTDGMIKVIKEFYRCNSIGFKDGMENIRGVPRLYDIEESVPGDIVVWKKGNKKKYALRVGNYLSVMDIGGQIKYTDWVTPLSNGYIIKVIMRPLTRDLINLMDKNRKKIYRYKPLIEELFEGEMDGKNTTGMFSNFNHPLWNTVYGYNLYRVTNKPVTEMTLSELLIDMKARLTKQRKMGLIKAKRSSASGASNVMKNTMLLHMYDLKLPGYLLFNPEIQMLFMLEDLGDATDEYTKGKKGIICAAIAVANKYASAAHVRWGWRSRYKQPIGTSKKELLRALRAVRKRTMK